jgi:hypothetical protein
LGMACSNKAIEAGTCGDETLIALQESCIGIPGCSSSGSQEASGLDSCGLAVNVLTQSGSGACAFEGQGSCAVACDCDNTDPQTVQCVQRGFEDCLNLKAPDASQAGCDGAYLSSYEQGINDCQGAWCEPVDGENCIKLSCCTASNGEIDECWYVLDGGAGVSCGAGECDQSDVDSALAQCR